MQRITPDLCDFTSALLKDFLDPVDVTEVRNVSLLELSCALSTYQAVNTLSRMNLEFQGQDCRHESRLISLLQRVKRCEWPVPADLALVSDATCGASLKYLSRSVTDETCV